MSDLYGVSRRRLVGEGAFWLALLVGAAIVLAVGGLGWRYVIASPKGSVEAREQIKSGANRIQAYDHFYDLCAAVQAQEGALAASYRELVTATGDDRKRVQTNITGILAQRSRSVAQYNADARKGYTIGQFRASDLPYELSPVYTEGATTSCVA